MAGGIAAASSRFSKLPRPQSSDVKAVAMWGVAAGTGALWFIQMKASNLKKLDLGRIHTTKAFFIFNLRRF
ncbi:hypothetical protein GBA52_021542 [Prunus armeniaca]|nr:hypothetical protein GBA52_021542 [Prunus armeniaca]